MTSLFKRQMAGSDALALRIARKELRSASPSVLRHWSNNGVALALWERTWDPVLTTKLDQLGFHELPRTRFQAKAVTAEVDVTAALADTQCHDETVMAALATDIESLICRFAEATGINEVEVRLEAIRDDACRLFHADRMRARLVTTYRGPGTEWVTPADADNALKNPEGFSGTVHPMPRFAVGLFPGSLAPQGPLVHRSPRIRETGEFRLFLSINEPFRAAALN
ncbi:MAG: DUF1826 domain-containing protein [Hyphomicrobiaceae bacterium]